VTILQGKIGFFGFKRSQKNFCEADGFCRSFPGEAESVFRFDVNHRKTYIIQYMIASALPHSLWAALNFSLLAGATGSVAYLWRHNLETNLEIYPDGLKNFDQGCMRLMDLVNSFSFLPVLMLSFGVSREATRWVTFIDLAYATQGRIQEIALLLGGAFNDVNTAGLAAKRRAAQYKFYRYLNVAHLLCYFGIDPRLQDADQVRDDLVSVKLLTEEEANKLVYCPEKRMREVAMAWLSGLWNEHVKSGALSPAGTNIFMQKLMALRAAVIHVEKAPTLMIVMLDVTCRILLFFVLLGQPVRMLKEDVCLQPWGILLTFCIFFCYHGMLTVMRTLEKSPFDPRADCINVDVLLCDTERVVFHVMRQGYAPHRLRRLRADNQLNGLGVSFASSAFDGDGSTLGRSTSSRTIDMMDAQTGSPGAIDMIDAQTGCLGSDVSDNEIELHHASTNDAIEIPQGNKVADVCMEV